MTRYLTFLYEPASNEVVGGSLARQPRFTQPEGSQWKVIRDVGRVSVIARVDGRTAELASARWRDGMLSDFEQEGARPTPVEWRALELVLQANLTPTAAKPAPESVEPAEPAVPVMPAEPAEPAVPASPDIKRYLTFLLDLQSTADNKAIAKSVRYAPDATAVPRPFVWKIVRDAADRVFVYVHGTGWAKPIATARWNGSGVRDQRQRDPREPNGNQWKWIERALHLEGVTEAARASRCDVTEEAPSFTARPVVPESDQATRSSPPRPVSNTKPAREFLTYLAVVGLGVAAIVGLKRACTSSGPVKQEGAKTEVPAVTRKQPIPRAAEPAPAPARAPDPEPSPEERVAGAATFADAIALAKPAMADSTDELPAGAALLARYGKLRWSDVEADETTVAKVQKDAEPERGKRLCAEGEIERITRRDIERRKAFVGRLALADGDALAFVAVGTTGELVKRMRARFCGVVTGVHGSDVAVLGMFDLPENRTPQVEQ
ncbi:MAG: hypothetical protein JNL83_03120 [Myxococcales bacterium]|nr:hypothetical protein [Myxococcales bacterium]